jgi:MFS family permease
MLATQIAAACVLAAVPVMAPAIAITIGVDSSLVGVYSGLVFAAAMIVSAWSGAFIARLGPVRTNQLALVGTGLALLVASGATLSTVALTGLLVGAGYGPNTPTGSQVLARVTPLHRQALAFSLKQSGAPLGGMLAGFMLPPIVLLAGWKVAVVVVFAFAIATAIAIEPLRRQIDPLQRSSESSERISAPASMRFVLEDQSLRRLMAGGVALMVAHACFQTLFVAYLVDHVKLSLAIAGVLYASMQASGAVSRLVIGWGVDRLRSPRAILSVVAGIALLGTALVAAFSDRWPPGAIWLVCVIVGIGSSGWYGAFLSEIARAASIERAGFATGGALFFVYGANVVTPIIASVLVAMTGSYMPVFATIAVLAGVAAVSFARVGSDS